jgi:hypothetical protein
VVEHQPRKQEAKFNPLVPEKKKKKGELGIPIIKKDWKEV